MKIETKGEKYFRFKDIDDCECFKNEAGDLFMKIPNDENAVSLEYGTLWDFGSETKVVPVNAKVVIE